MHSAGRLEFQIGFGNAKRPQPARDEHDGDAAQRVLVLADFSGAAPRDPLALRRAVRVEIDRLDDVFAGFHATWSVADPDTGRVSSLDDLHPDALLQRDRELAGLLAARRALDTAGAADAADTLSRLLRTTPPPAAGSAAATAPESDSDTLSRLLGSPPAPVAIAPSDLQSIIGAIARSSPSSVPAAPAGTAGLAVAAELELSTRLRARLRDPQFRAMERAWRSLDFLVRRCPDEERVAYFALDVSAAEIIADTSDWTRLLRTTRCGLVIVDHVFGESPDDLRALVRIAAAARATDSRLVAGAHPGLVGCPGFGISGDPDDWNQPPAEALRSAWAALRHSPDAAIVTLALPRFILRQPYGRAGAAIESFDFEELMADPDHEAFAWGNAAFLAAQAMIEARTAAIDDLPSARYCERGGSALKPCAEAWLPDRAVSRLTACGLTSIQAVRNSDRVRVALVPVESTP